MDPVTVFMILAAGATVAKGVFQAEAANEQEKALNLKNELQTLQYQQKKLSTYSLLEKTLATQTAEATTRGVSLGSASLGAIQQETWNIGGRQLGNIEAEKDIMGRNINVEKSNVRKTLYASLFGDAADLAMSGAKLAA